MSQYKSILITGGAGFIGSNFIHYLFGNLKFKGKVVNYDKLTYAGNLENLKQIEECYGRTRYYFEHGDICNAKKFTSVIEKYSIDCIVNFAAETHVDRSIITPNKFIKTNIEGTFSILEVLRCLNAGNKQIRFHHISTDEVFGSLGEAGYFTEESPYNPCNPYSASKAASDHMVKAYYNTYKLPVTISNCSNNYGRYQFPEKLIPFMIVNMVHNKKLPIYGDGENVRDWIYVDDHSRAVWTILNKGKIGQTYNIGGEHEWQNIKLVEKLCEIVAKESGNDENCFKKLIEFVHDRPGHDRRYAMDCTKIKNDLGFKLHYSFEKGLMKTVKWYLSHLDWVKNVQSGEYMKWIERNYSKR